MKIDVLESFLSSTDLADANCTGLVFRYRESRYATNKRKFTQKREVWPLIRQSCRCQSCLGQLDCFYEDCACGDIVFDNNLIDNDLCCLVYEDVQTDWETGAIDSYTPVIKKLTSPKITNHQLANRRKNHGNR